MSPSTRALPPRRSAGSGCAGRTGRRRRALLSAALRRAPQAPSTLQRQTARRESRGQCPAPTGGSDWAPTETCGPPRRRSARPRSGSWCRVRRWSWRRATPSASRSPRATRWTSARTARACGRVCGSTAACATAPASSSTAWRRTARTFLREPLRSRSARWRSNDGRTMTFLPLADPNFAEATWILIVKSIVIFAVVMGIVLLLTVAERKILGRFQARYGPNRVGPVGLLQPLADAVKLISKEHFQPRNAVGLLWVAGPVLVVFSGLTALAIIPFGDVQNGFGLYGIDV